MVAAPRPARGRKPLASPEKIEARRVAGRKAAAARHSVDTLIRQIVERAPELTPEQGAKLRAIFAEPAPAARRGGADAA